MSKHFLCSYSAEKARTKEGLLHTGVIPVILKLHCSLLRRGVKVAITILSEHMPLNSVNMVHQ